MLVVNLVALQMMQDDLLSWLMDIAPPGPLSSTEGIASRMLFINFSALHTTAMVSIMSLCLVLLG